MNAPQATGKILRWVDGDTVWIATRLRVTKAAPELNTPQGRAAKDAMTRRLPKGREIRFTVRWVDSYGRIVADMPG